MEELKEKTKQNKNPYRKLKTCLIPSTIYCDQYVIVGGLFVFELIKFAFKNVDLIFLGI